MRHKHILLASAACVVLSTIIGCASTLAAKRPRDAQTLPIDRNSTEASLIAAYLDTCLKVARGTPAEQAEVLATASNDYSVAPYS